MTDALEQLLQDAAAGVSRTTQLPGLAGLRRRARRRRAVGVVAAPLLVAALVAGTVVAARPGPPGQVAAGPSAVFDVEVEGATSAGPLNDALYACASRAHATPTARLGTRGSYRVQVEGSQDAAAFTACVGQVPGLAATRADVPDLDLRQAHALWERRGSRDYTYEVQHVCQVCTSSRLRVTVVDGRAVTSTPVAGSGPDGFHFPAVSIDELFALLEHPEQASAAEAHAVYDSEMGFPTRVDVDRDLRAIDDEYGYLVSDYRPGVPTTG